jgi:hypothetical protein
MTTAVYEHVERLDQFCGILPYCGADKMEENVHA